MVVRLDAQVLQPATVCSRAALSVVVRDDNPAYHEASVLEFRPQPQDVLVVGYAQVVAHLVLLDVLCADYDDYLYRAGQLLEHPQFAVGLESWQDPARMVVVEELAPEFKVKLALELCYPLLYLP